jgi:hypothetical protein
MARPSGVDPIDDAGDGFDARQVGRSALWTVLAVVAMVGAIAAARSDAGLRRISTALEGTSGGNLLAWSPATAPTAGSVAVASLEAETRRLERAVSALTNDRDRMLKRLALLEQNVEVTGSVPKTSRAAEERPQPGPAAPVVASVTLIPAPAPNGTVQAAVEAAGPQIAAASSVVTHTQFGIDLGPGADLDALRGRWTALKAAHAALLEGLHPLVSLRENGQKGGIELRLVAGPLGNAAAAARLCAVIGAADTPCQPGPFEGQALALR